MTDPNYSRLQQLLEDYVEERLDELHIPILKQRLNSVTALQRWQVLTGKSASPENLILAAAVRRNHPEVVRCLLSSLLPHQRFELLKRKFLHDWPCIDTDYPSLLHYTALYGDRDIMRCILKSVSAEERCELLKVVSQSGNTPLHWTAVRGHTETTRYILDSVSTETQLRLLGIKNKYNWTPIDVALEYNHIETADFIRRRKSSAEVRCKKTQGALVGWFILSQTLGMLRD